MRLTPSSAHAAAERGDGKLAARRLMYTVAGAATFIIVKSFEWTAEIQAGYTITASGFWAFYYTAAGIHAAHVFYLLVPEWDDQGALIAELRSRGIVATFHYVPLDSSRAGRRFGRALRPLDRAEDLSRRLVRLPLWTGMNEDDVTRVVEAVRSWAPGGSGTTRKGRR